MAGLAAVAYNLLRSDEQWQTHSRLHSRHDLGTLKQSELDFAYNRRVIVSYLKTRYREYEEVSRESPLYLSASASTRSKAAMSPTRACMSAIAHVADTARLTCLVQSVGVRHQQCNPSLGVGVINWRIPHSGDVERVIWMAIVHVGLRSHNTVFEEQLGGDEYGRERVEVD